MQPTVGRIVHYTSAIDETLAAIITQVDATFGAGRVGLAILRPPSWFGEPVQREFASFSETPRPLHWSWPPREEAQEPAQPARPISPRDAAYVTRALGPWVRQQIRTRDQYIDALISPFLARCIAEQLVEEAARAESVSTVADPAAKEAAKP